MWIDQRGAEVLARDECRRLLAAGAGGVGRVGLVDVGHHVVIEPVNYRMLGDDVLIRIGPGSMLDAAARRAILSFEIDEVAPDAAWSVLVRGQASVEENPSAAAHATPVGGDPLVPEPGATLVRIRTHIISGRRFARRGAPSGT